MSCEKPQNHQHNAHVHVDKMSQIHHVNKRSAKPRLRLFVLVSTKKWESTVSAAAGVQTPHSQHDGIVASGVLKPLSEVEAGHRLPPNDKEWNTLCAHGCVVVDGDRVFVCATRGRARDLLRSGHSGPKTIADLMAAIVPRPCAVCTNPPPSGPNSLLVFTSFTGVPPAPHGAFSLMTRVS